MNAPIVVLVIAALLLLVSVAEPLANRLKLPFSVVLAVLGMVLGSASILVLQSDLTPTSNRLAQTIAGFPVNSQVFLTVFLPLLLFQTSLNIPARAMMEDAAAIFVLAVVAVVVATFTIGLALWPFAGLPLAACLLLGAVVATTDPVAVVGIFRDVGAPARLRRLVEGESLLNDAAAVALFLLFLSLIVAPGPVAPLALGGHFVGIMLGGALFGWIAARSILRLVQVVGDNPLGQVSLSLVLPYATYIVADRLLGLSGVVAVVAAGLTMNLAGPARIDPQCWRHLRAVWEQLEYWASTLVFVLAAIIVPKLLHGLGLRDLGLLAVLIAAALGARALILFAVLPLLSKFGWSPPVEARQRAVMLWGGMRGAMTLALALSLVESKSVPASIQQFVAVLATGFVLFTLLVQATTLRPLIRLLGLDRLKEQDLRLRQHVLAVARRDVQEEVRQIAGRYGLPASAPEGPDSPAADPIGAASRATERTAAVTLARRERELVVSHFAERTMSKSLVARMISDADRLVDRARTQGVSGYREEAARQLGFPRTFRFAQFLHRHGRGDGLLAKLVAERFELLMLRCMLMDDIGRFLSEEAGPVLGSDLSRKLESEISGRRDAIADALAALRLQYPNYAEALERFFLTKTALRLEEREYDRLHEDGLIGPELHRELRQDVMVRRMAAAHRPRLDLELDTDSLIAHLPLLQAASPDMLRGIARLLQPVFAVPGEVLIRQGERGDAAYLIASGAVEVDAPAGRAKLGRGDVFGELALLRDEPRSADVRSIAYSSLLRLSRQDFHHFLAQHPQLAEEIHAKAGDRLRQNLAHQTAAPLPAV